MLSLMFGYPMFVCAATLWQSVFVAEPCAAAVESLLSSSARAPAAHLLVERYGCGKLRLLRRMRCRDRQSYKGVCALLNASSLTYIGTLRCDTVLSGVRVVSARMVPARVRI